MFRASATTSWWANGLVVGLDGQGDRNQVKFTAQSIMNMLRQFGVQIDDADNPKLRNVASVSVTAMVDPMAGPGQALDIVVSSIGDAKSLRWRYAFTYAITRRRWRSIRGRTR